mmetsp:Transcript_1647/g.4446  ORF Transcript_1647/g.4446 Transcript_1647/m.4446 type:complete len:289 (-) Transcript_1647:316-1182(-)
MNAYLVKFTEEEARQAAAERGDPGSVGRRPSPDIRIHTPMAGGEYGAYAGEHGGRGHFVGEAPAPGALYAPTELGSTGGPYGNESKGPSQNDGLAASLVEPGGYPGAVGPAAGADELEEYADDFEHTAVSGGAGPVSESSFDGHGDAAAATGANAVAGPMETAAETAATRTGEAPEEAAAAEEDAAAIGMSAARDALAAAVEPETLAASAEPDDTLPLDDEELAAAAFAAGGLDGGVDGGVDGVDDTGEHDSGMATGTADAAIDGDVDAEHDELLEAAAAFGEEKHHG